MPSKPKSKVSNDTKIILAAIKDALKSNKIHEKQISRDLVVVAADEAKVVADRVAFRAQEAASLAAEVAEIAAARTVSVAKSAAELVAETAVAASKSLADELSRHTVQDDGRFTELTAMTQEIATDVKSLISTRTFTYGVWKTLTVIGVVAVGAGSALAFLVPFLQKLAGN